MSLAAAIYLSNEASGQWALSSVAGRSVLLRLLITAVRAGVKEIGLPRILADESALSRIRSHPQLALTVFSLEHRGLGADLLLLLPAHGIVDRESLRKLHEVGKSGVPAALEESKGSPAPVLVITGQQAQALRQRLVAGTPVGEELESQVRSGRLRLVAGGGYFVPVTDASSQRRAEMLLYSMLGTDADSFVDRAINRRLSRRLTHLLIQFPVTPNQVSLATLGLGLASASGFWFATPLSALLGLLLYMLAVVADHCDGEVARLTFQESALGRWLDIFIDTVINVLLVMGMAVTASTAHGTLALVGGGVAGFGIIMCALLANFFPPRPTRAPRLARLLRGIGNRDLFYLVLVAFIVSLWKAPLGVPILLSVLAVGSQVYWLTCLVQRIIASR
ncbi:MAG: CDP-alcohol phosphatidyltransferase family protein [Candidatus Methylomirabilia bacterium]